MKIKEFMSETRHDVWKLIQTHVVMMIFGVMVYMPIGIESDKRRLLSFVFGLLTAIFYYYLIDLYMWDIGAKDAIRVKSGTLPNRPWKGFVTGLFAAIPDLVLGILFCIFHALREYGAGYGLANYIFTLATRTWEGMFVGLEMSIFGTVTQVVSEGVTQTLVDVSFGGAYIITPFIAAAFAGFSYYCGTKEFTVIPRPRKKAK